MKYKLKCIVKCIVCLANYGQSWISWESTSLFSSGSMVSEYWTISTGSLKSCLVSWARMAMRLFWKSVVGISHARARSMSPPFFRSSVLLPYKYTRMSPQTARMDEIRRVRRGSGSLMPETLLQTGEHVHGSPPVFGHWFDINITAGCRTFPHRWNDTSCPCCSCLALAPGREGQSYSVALWSVVWWLLHQNPSIPSLQDLHRCHFYLFFGKRFIVNINSNISMSVIVVY